MRSWRGWVHLRLRHLIATANNFPDLIKALAYRLVSARRQTLLPQEIIDRLMHAALVGAAVSESTRLGSRQHSAVTCQERPENA